MYDSDSVPSIHSHGDLPPSPHPASPPSEVVSPLSRSSVLLEELPADPKWILEEDGFTLAREHEIESLFTIANGYIGNRGSLAEGSSLSAPATFAAGVFELPQKTGAVPGYFVLPDWAGVRAWIEGHPLSMEQGQILRHRRVLDLRRGILWREWHHRDVNGRVTRIVSFRLASLADRHLLVHSVAFTPENYSGHIQLECCIELPKDTSPPPEEWKARRSAMRPNVLPLAMRAPGRDTVVAIGAASQLVCHGHDAGRREMDISERRITERFDITADIGVDYRLDRLVSIYTTRETEEPVEAAVAHVNSLFPAGVRNAVAAHRSAWDARWHDADIYVEGDELLQRALRFAEYHLISSANPEDERVSIGARALTGESYKGHVFWDTEIYMVPFYTFTDPPSARSLLLYRYHTLAAAREKAKAAGYRGAMYPWESADTGEETTPRFVIDPKGQVIEVLNGEMEVHITSDIAYAVWQHWEATADDDFMLHGGADIMLETARFWASRGRVEEDGRYHIRHVIGPDEYHEDVDDSAYTNLMAAWNMRRGIDITHFLQQRWPDKWRELQQSLRLTADEPNRWSRLADAMFLPFDPNTRLFEQFAGYYQREPIHLLDYEPRNAAMDVILGHARINQTNVVKQADVVMAMYLLWNQFPDEVRRANFNYYEPRTGHGSSLSPSIHALIAARFDDVPMAEKYLKQAAEIDLGNNMGNAAGGVHAAAIGGLWQAMVFGFAGLELRADCLTFNPHLLPRWQRLTFPVQYRGSKLRVALDPERIRVVVEEGNAVKVALGSSEVQLPPRRDYVCERKQGKWGAWREAQS